MNETDKEKLTSIKDNNDVFSFSICRLKKYLNLLNAPNSRDFFTGEVYRAIENRLNLALQLQIKNDLKKPHWSVTPTFIITFLAMLFAAIAAWPVIRGCVQVYKHDHINSISQVQQSQSTQESQGELKNQIIGR